MAYKTITVIVTDDMGDAPALDAALAIAQREGAHLDVHCLGIDPARYDVMPVGATAMILESGAQEARERADHLVEWVRKAMPATLVRHAVQPVVVPQLGLDTMVSRLARYSDLFVATKPYGPGRSPLQVTVLEAALFGTGAAILIVPDAVHDYSVPFRRVVVAWNESDESFAVVRAAMPVLTAADHVDIVMVDPPSHTPERSDPGGSVSVMLSRQGVRTEVSILARTLPRVSEVLARFAGEHGADAIVMGAYGHSRFRESILGGATRDMLETTTVPLIMAH